MQKLNNYMKRCSTSLAINVMPIKTTVYYQYAPIIMPNIQKDATYLCDDVCILELSYVASMNIKWNSHLGKRFGS